MSSTPENPLHSPSQPTAAASRPGLPGHYVVIGLFGFGIVATAAIYIYWSLHTAPFRPLTEAIGREFPRSLPKVEGGSFKGSEPTLRVAMRIPFDPSADTEERQHVITRVCELAEAKVPLAEFRELQVHLFQFAPEKVAKQASAVFVIEDGRVGEPISNDATPRSADPETAADTPAATTKAAPE